VSQLGVWADVRVRDKLGIVLWVGRTFFRGTSGESTDKGQFVFFDSIDCTGQAWLQNINTSPLPLSAVTSPGNTVYIADAGSSGQELSMHSILVNPEIGGQCFRVDPTPMPVVPAHSVVDLYTLFTPPFHIKLP